MGAKFYRGSDKPKKIRKRLSQTRTWTRQFYCLACKLPVSNLTAYPSTSNLLTFAITVQTMPIPCTLPVTPLRLLLPTRLVSSLTPT